ncbi:hypothetical protein C5749_05400 [Sphingobacterium gobiense]|uniref:DoxX family protein n=1 Tax=Sphingobacterium gobiense TaxID=1382456 RepID=A0A2S9JTW9_9SPHI|nr:hypothetical protein C5749_05400 [Sphingobacterium gobiense]
MNTFLIIANVIVLISVIVHMFLGDKDIKSIMPDLSEHKRFENWIMARGAFHVVSVDILMITAGLTLINFTDLLDPHRTILLQIMSIYFLLYAVFFLIVVTVSGSLPKKFLKLCQWALFLILSGLIYFGI